MIEFLTIILYSMIVTISLMCLAIMCILVWIVFKMFKD
jgi:hypothetical protein